MSSLWHPFADMAAVKDDELVIAKGRGALVWDEQGREYVDEVDYIRVYIRRLREKLGDNPDNPRYIRTERGLGYRFVAEEPA